MRAEPADSDTFPQPCKELNTKRLKAE